MADYSDDQKLYWECAPLGQDLAEEVLRNMVRGSYRIHWEVVPLGQELAEQVINRVIDPGQAVAEEVDDDEVLAPRVSLWRMIKGLFGKITGRRHGR